MSNWLSREMAYPDTLTFCLAGYSDQFDAWIAEAFVKAK